MPNIGAKAMKGNGLVTLAHSPRVAGEPGDPYERHVKAVRAGTVDRARDMLRYAQFHCDGLLDSIDAAALFHDLGKLDPENQAALQKGRRAPLKWDHIDAGVAYVTARRNWMAAWLVRAHHAPGLPEKEEHFNQDGIGRCLRGRRRDDDLMERHQAQKERTDAKLLQYLTHHESAVGSTILQQHPASHGLTMRLALSCLVDADHADTAYFDSGCNSDVALMPRWNERLDLLTHYVERLPTGDSDSERQRNLHRSAFFRSCLNSSVADPMVACEGPVGLGKTTAVAAYLLRRARDENLRRLIFVAPYTNILSQTASRLRKALVLPGENPHRVVVEHHHRADFESENDRDMAVLWRAPFILTTAASFFETLAACAPAALRKLHAVPGSAVFIDEAHAALPTHLWPQNWLWLNELASKWSCRFVFASGSLSRFWENAQINAKPCDLPELLPHDQAKAVLNADRSRIHYVQLKDGHVIQVPELVEFVQKADGPRLVILNTVQNAAVVANALRLARLDVLHLSTALTPSDRLKIIKKVERRLGHTKNSDWVLVATSCVEAGVDFSFRCAFRERFSVASTLQTGGRVNRHGEFDSMGGSVVYDFALQGPGVTQHPGASVSSEVLRKALERDDLNSRKPADVVTDAMNEELAKQGGLGNNALRKAEAARNYPDVAKHGKVIDADTRLVVVDARLKALLKARRPVNFNRLLRGSVQLWSNRIDELGLESLPGRDDIYTWNDLYDPYFLGYMAGVLKNLAFLQADGCVI